MSTFYTPHWFRYSILCLLIYTLTLFIPVLKNNLKEAQKYVETFFFH